MPETTPTELVHLLPRAAVLRNLRRWDGGDARSAIWAVTSYLGRLGHCQSAEMRPRLVPARGVAGCRGAHVWRVRNYRRRVHARPWAETGVPEVFGIDPARPSNTGAEFGYQLDSSQCLALASPQHAAAHRRTPRVGPPLLGECPGRHRAANGPGRSETTSPGPIGPDDASRPHGVSPASRAEVTRPVDQTARYPRPMTGIPSRGLLRASAPMARLGYAADRPGSGHHCVSPAAARPRTPIGREPWPRRSRFSRATWSGSRQRRSSRASFRRFARARSRPILRLRRRAHWYPPVLGLEPRVLRTQRSIRQLRALPRIPQAGT